MLRAAGSAAVVADSLAAVFTVVAVDSAAVVFTVAAAVVVTGNLPSAEFKEQVHLRFADRAEGHCRSTSRILVHRHFGLDEDSSSLIY
jgi:hypothetical protein